MSNFETKQQVRPEANVRKVGNVARGTGGKGSQLVGLIDQALTADLPDAADVGNGVLMYNLTTSKLQITISGSWVDVA